ncbi:MAG: N-acetylmuramoyl-L-alanine amidase [Chloroflexota bacterium]
MARRASALIIAISLLVSIAALAAPARAATNPTVTNPTVNLVINGKPITTDVPAQLIGERTMVPARAVFETLGAKVGWIDASRTVTVDYLDHAVSVRIGVRTATVDGRSVQLDVAPVIVGDRTLVPLRFIAESIGARVGWIQTPRTATVDIAPSITAFSWMPGTGHGTLHIASTGAVAATARRETDPERIVIDLPGSTLATTDVSGVKPDRSITHISATADDSGVHVTLGLTGPTGFRLVQGDAGVDVEIGYRVTGVTYDATGEDEKILIKTVGPAAYRLTRLTNPDRLAIDFDLSAISEPLELDADGKYIDSVRVGQYSADPAIARVVIDFRADAVPVGIVRTSSGLELTVSEKYSAPLAGRTIYIDPGHGGTDPGALGVSGTREADVNLDTARRLQELLRNAGANAVLTRDGDYYVELYTRPALANADQADIYVSLHSNWYTSASANGTEVYYYFTNPDSARLASAVHDALIGQLGLRDRGVQTERFAVIRVAQMPSILVESAFLSNANEDRLLATPEFRQRVAVGVYQGILAYFAGAAAQ